MATDKTSLGDRMKGYENITRNHLIGRMPVILRLDGCHFHTFARGFDKPYDKVLAKSMEDTMRYLCEHIQGCVLGYTQSDEITLVLVDYQTFNASSWFDNGIQKMTRDAKKDMDATIEDAIALVQGADYDVTGIAMAPAVRSELAAITNNGAKIYPQLAWGSAPGMINGLPVQVNSTVANKGLDLFVAGDFATNFKWGYAKQIPIEVIQYGDPDNTGVDLKGSNQVALRGEAYMGWTIFQPEAFALCASADA